MRRGIALFAAGVLVGALLALPLAVPAHTRTEWRAEWTAEHPLPQLHADLRHFERPVARAVRQVYRADRAQAVDRMWRAFRGAKKAWAEAARYKETPPSLDPPPPHSGRADWYAIAVCESGHNPPAWHINTLNPFWGGLQFLPSTWFAYGGGPFTDTGTNPFPYSAAQQIAVAERVLAGQGPQAWPHCFRWAA